MPAAAAVGAALAGTFVCARTIPLIVVEAEAGAPKP